MTHRNHKEESSISRLARLSISVSQARLEKIQEQIVTEDDLENPPKSPLNLCSIKITTPIPLVFNNSGKVRASSFVR